MLTIIRDDTSFLRTLIAAFVGLVAIQLLLDVAGLAGLTRVLLVWMLGAIVFAWLLLQRARYLRRSPFFALFGLAPPVALIVGVVFYYLEPTGDDIA